MDNCLFRKECEIWVPSCSLGDLIDSCYPRFPKEVLPCNICSRKEVICCKINKSVWCCSECFRDVIFPRIAKRIGLEADVAGRIKARILKYWDYPAGSTIVDFSQLAKS